MWLSRPAANFVVLVHSSGTPSDEALDKTCHELSDGTEFFLPFAYGDSRLTVLQRRRIGETIRLANVTVAAVMENPMQRRVAVAISWLVRSMKVFSASPGDLEKAYRSIGAEQMPDLARLVADLHAEAGLEVPPVLPGALPGGLPGDLVAAGLATSRDSPPKSKGRASGR